jgi:hypothetical protein
MRKYLSILAVAAAVGIGILASTGSANAAPSKPNHGQCVSGAAHAGVKGAAFEAIAKNNALVGEYGSATCPLVPVVEASRTATFTVLQPKDATNQFDNVWTHVYVVTVKADGTFTGVGSITDNGGAFAWGEDITGQVLNGHITFNTVPIGGGATFAVTDAPMDNTTVDVVSTWTANTIQFRIGALTFA